MRIGIDAKWYFSGPPSGVNVVRNIVNNIIEFNEGNEILFILNKKDIHLKNIIIDKINNKNNLFLLFIPCKINFLTNLFILPFYLKKKKLDVMLFQNYIPLWGDSKTKYVNYVHDILFLDYPQYFTTLERIIYRLMLTSIKQASHVITISKSERNRIITHTNILSENISFVYHGLDPIFQETTEDIKEKIKIKYNLPDDFILFVGRINIRKNIITLLRSCSILKNDISLVIVGKEEKNGFDIKAEICKLGIENKVNLIGYLPDDELAKIVSSAKIFVFLSYAEGFGLPPLEAMKSGVPTIISNVTSLPEVCGDAAISIDVDDYRELAFKIELLLKDKELYNYYKNKGLNKSKEYTWNKSIIKILDILKAEKK